MDDTISRKEALEAFGLSEKTRKYGGDHSGYDTMMLYEIQDVLESLPSARDTGKWLDLPLTGMCVCSNCGYMNTATTYCPDCGSKNITRCDGDSCPIEYKE